MYGLRTRLSRLTRGKYLINWSAFSAGELIELVGDIFSVFQLYSHWKAIIIIWYKAIMGQQQKLGFTSKLSNQINNIINQLPSKNMWEQEKRRRRRRRRRTHSYRTWWLCLFIQFNSIQFHCATSTNQPTSRFCSDAFGFSGIIYYKFIGTHALSDCLVLVLVLVLYYIV